MLTEEELVILRGLVFEKAHCLRTEQKKIEHVRGVLENNDYMEKEYKECLVNLVNLHVIFTKLCHTIT